MIEDIQKKELFILDKTIDILNSKGITWFAAYGTLLGAIRDGGFIPWDDDVDIFVPREDFNRLIENGSDWFCGDLYLETTEKCSFLRHFMKVLLKGTTCIRKEHYDLNGNFGMFIDIFPLDHVPEDKAKRDSVITALFELKRNLMYALYGPMNSTDKFSVGNINKSYDMFMTLINGNNKRSNYTVQVGLGYPTQEEIVLMDSSCFESYDEIKFRGLKNNLRIPKDSEKLLSAWYGSDWRIPKNYGRLSDNLVDPNKDYTEYKNLPKDEFYKLFK